MVEVLIPLIEIGAAEGFISSDIALGIAGLPEIALFGGVTAATAINYGALIGASIGLNYAISALQADPNKENAAGQVTTRQALPARFVYFGRARTAGVLFFNDALTQ